MTWAPTWTLEVIRATWSGEMGRLANIPESDLVVLLSLHGYFVGPDHTVWASEEHYLKASTSQV